MAKKKRASKKDSYAEGSEVVAFASNLRMEALGVVFLLLAGLLCFALAVFDPSDQASGRRLIGPVGTALAEVILGGIGALGYVVAVAAVLGGGAVLLGRARWPSALAVGSAFAICVAATVLAHLTFGESFVLGYPAGGLVGALLAGLLSGVLGTVGAGLFSFSVVLLGLIGLGSVSLGTVMRDTGRFAKWLFVHTVGQVLILREAKQAGLDHEEALIAAEEEKRLEKARRIAEKEQALKDKLEEKKRLAIMKAKASAEERVLKKVAEREAREALERELAEKAKAEAEAKAAEGPAAATEDPAAATEEEAAPWDLGTVEAPSSEPEVVIAHSPVKPLDDEEEEAEDEDDEALYEDEGSGDEEESEEDEEAYDDEEAYEDEDEAEEDESAEEEDEAASPLARAFGRRSASGVEDPESFLGPQIFDERPEGAPEDILNGEAEPEHEEPEAPRVYELPPVKLLDYNAAPPAYIDEASLKSRATRLEEKLRTYGVDGRVTAIRPGPVVTTYEYQPAPGVKVSKIAGLSDDIAMSMEAKSVRIIAPIPGKGVVGIELPNETREAVYLKEIIAHDRFQRSKSLLNLALGKDTEGDTQCRDLAKMPHLLVAGTTGSGKSVSVNAMILSILYKATPDQVKFIMVDPKMLELSLYNDIPHLLLPVVTDPQHASRALQWAVDEMERRYRMLSDFKVRNIEGFNKKLQKLRDQRAFEDEFGINEEQERIEDPWKEENVPKDLPYIVVLIDEFADLMCVAPRDVEASVQRLAQKARAAGIHLMLATQRPSTDVITGVIKNNFPSRISFRVSSRHDSSTIINAPGAENLLGQGDMLMLGNDGPVPIRIHGAYVTEDEVQRVAEFWKAQAKPCYDQTILKPREDEGGEDEDDFERDEMYDRAVAFVLETKKASISAVQRKLRVGYNRAARMVELMEKEGLVTAPMGPKGERELLASAMGPDGPPRV